MNTNEDQYMILYGSEDGPQIMIMSKTVLNKFIADNGSEKTFWDFDVVQYKNIDLDTFPADSILIFKGSIAVPKPIKQITQYEIE